MDQDTTARDADDADDRATVAVDAPEADELLIEEISIDGMCGVY
jgi:mycofactocin precursor